MPAKASDTVWGIRSHRVVLPERIADATVLIQGEKILDIKMTNGVLTGFEIVDVGNKVIMPGIVDSHVHINEPGRTEWEGFRTATEAAAAGGITTVVDMPLNSIPATTNAEALETKARVAESQCSVDYAFWGGLIPGNARELARMVQAGACGFKAFLIDSGVAEFPAVTRKVLEQSMPTVAGLRVPLLVHAELDGGQVQSAAARPPARTYSSYLASRPRAWENDAVRMMLDLGRKYGTHVHIVHLSSADVLSDISRARTNGVAVTVETCPHYLTFAAEEIPDGATPYKCAPPIREAENREKLWKGVRDGVIDMIVSDHSPCAPSLKRSESGDFASAWGGISSLQFGSSIIWTGMHERRSSLTEFVRTMCRAPAELAGLADRKGRLIPGFDADLVVFDPDESFSIDANTIRHRHPVTPYLGRGLRGRVETTYLRGQKIFADGNVLMHGAGKRLFRRTA